ncbi:hypothetical protein KVR01_000544 [Diaporthe batatas]|uniref:uncharacterized protein n=1 Tax=Diaporthe batatas TaxID=748121 RepID=UPI001D04A2F5|nr:uncharacterized protein KVR01_000544 [Diaporthe batatas]KAG8169799.1 hypothetical protein KVR01_000544 [Diaporthe batatas]
MKFTASVLFTIFAVSAVALPEPVEEAAGALPRCVANQPNCAGSKYIGGDNCRCSGQKAPCGNWKCGWDGAHSIRMLMDQLNDEQSLIHASPPPMSIRGQTSGIGPVGGDMH